MHLEANGLLHTDNIIEKTALFIVFQPRIQATLDAAAAAWNVHQMRTTGHKSPQVIWHLSRTEALRKGYWHEDPGDDLFTASDPLYGVDGQGPLPSDAVMEEELVEGIRIHDDARLKQARILLAGVDLERDDGNRGMDVYQEVVRRLEELWDQWAA